MRMTDFEKGLRSPEEFMVARYRFQRQRSHQESKPRLSLNEKRARRRLAVDAVKVLGEHQKVAERLGLHATAVTRWVNGHTAVPSRHLPTLMAIVDGQ